MRMDTSRRKAQPKTANHSEASKDGRSSSTFTRNPDDTTNIVAVPSPHGFASHRPFSPSAIAANSGKRIKAFFKHRSSADDANGQGVPTSPFGLRRISSRISSDGVGQTRGNRERVLSPNSAAASGRSGKQSLPATNVGLAGNTDREKSIAESTIRFPGTEKEATNQSVPIDQQEIVAAPRKPKRSLSLFRSASKTKPVAKVSASEILAGKTNDAPRATNTLKSQRPVSVPLSQSSRSSTEVKSTVTTGGTVQGMTCLTARSSISRDTPEARTSTKASSVDIHRIELERRGSPLRSSTPKQRQTTMHPKSTLPLDRASPSLTLDTATPVPSSRLPTPTGRESSNHDDVDREAHYLLRMASTYLSKTVMPEAKVVASHKNTHIVGNQEARIAMDRTATTPAAADVLRGHVYETIKLLERMERAWGIEWMLRGKEGFVVSESRKEKERDCFRRVVDDGVVLCL